MFSCMFLLTGEDEAACANDLSIAMSVIGLRKRYENLSAQKRSRVSFFRGRSTTPSVKSVDALS